MVAGQRLRVGGATIEITDTTHAASASSIIEKVNRGKQALESQH